MCTAIQRAPNAEPKPVREKTARAAPHGGVESPHELPGAQGRAPGRGVPRRWELPRACVGEVLAHVCTVKGFLS